MSCCCCDVLSPCSRLITECWMDVSVQFQWGRERWNITRNECNNSQPFIIVPASLTLIINSPWSSFNHLSRKRQTKRCLLANEQNHHPYDNWTLWTSCHHNNNSLSLLVFLQFENRAALENWSIRIELETRDICFETGDISFGNICILLFGFKIKDRFKKQIPIEKTKSWRYHRRTKCLNTGWSSKFRNPLQTTQLIVASLIQLPASH